MKFPDRFQTEHLQYVNYTLLDEQQSRYIWEARNHPDIRKWMTNPEPITWDEHKQFIEKLYTMTDRSYFAVFENSAGGGYIIGSQSINLIDNLTGESGLYILSEHQGKGYGRLMKKEFIKYIFENNLLQQITEKVKRLNIKNQQLNLSLGFKRISTDETYYYYSLKKGNLIT